MIYLGYFSFLKPNVDAGVLGDDAFGYFTTVAEAEDVESALKKFCDLILKLHEEEDILDEVTEIFLESCIECTSVPDSGFLAHFVQWFGIPSASISTAIRGATEKEAIAYSISTKVADGDSDEPFLVFDEA